MREAKIYSIEFVNKSLSWIARPSTRATLWMPLYANRNTATVMEIVKNPNPMNAMFMYLLPTAVPSVHMLS